MIYIKAALVSKSIGIEAEEGNEDDLKSSETYNVIKSIVKRNIN